MSESQGTDTKKREVVLADAAQAYAAGLEAAVLQGLGLAIENAVQAQQQLYVSGQAAFASAVVRRLSEEPEPPGANAEAASAASAEALERLRAGLSNAVSSRLESAGPEPAEITRTLMAAFAESLDLLSAVHAQQMMGYARVLVALGFDYDDKELGPAAAKALEEVFDGDAVVRLLAALAAERRGPAAGPAEG